MTAISATRLRLQRATGRGVRTVQGDTPYTLGEPVSIGGGAISVSLHDDAWRYAANDRHPGRTGLWLGAFADGFEGPACYVGLRRHGAGVVTMVRERGPDGAPCCIVSPRQP